jgi:hypothetical protein
MTSPSTSVSRGGSITDLVRLLIDAGAVRSGTPPDTLLEDMSRAASFSLNRALEVMRAADFIAAALVMLESGESRVSRFFFFS